jgi:hypothetical protein
MKSIIRFLKKLFGIFFFIETVLVIWLILFSKDESIANHRIIFIIIATLFAFLTYLLLFKKKKTNATILEPNKAIISSSSTIMPPTTQYESEYNEKKEYRQIYAKHTFLQYINLLDETCKIIHNTNNPKTLCSRYIFAKNKLAELSYYKTQAFIVKQFDFTRYHKIFSDDNFYKLALQCYQRYMDKAETELTTKKGIENRANKFWKIIQENTSSELYAKLKK